MIVYHMTLTVNVMNPETYTAKSEIKTAILARHFYALHNVMTLQ